MLKITLAAFAIALPALGLVPNPAQAQPARVFVAAQGLDSNPCTFAAPCRTFQHAHDVVAAGGEIDVLDPAGYGLLNITKAISIQGHGFAGIAAAPGSNAVDINAGASDRINLRGLLIDGVGVGNNGIRFEGGASLNIQESVVRNFTLAAIEFNSTIASSMAVSETIISENGGAGVLVFNNGSSVMSVVLERLALVKNVSGVVVQTLGSGGQTNLTLSGSVVAGSSQDGIRTYRNLGPTTAVAQIANSTFANNLRGVTVDQGSEIRIGRSSITGNGTGFFFVATGSPGVIHSYGDNNLDGNTTDGAPTDTIPRK